MKDELRTLLKFFIGWKSEAISDDNIVLAASYETKIKKTKKALKSKSVKKSNG